MIQCVYIIKISKREFIILRKFKAQSIFNDSCIHLNSYRCDLIIIVIIDLMPDHMLVSCSNKEKASWSFKQIKGKVFSTQTWILLYNTFWTKSPLGCCPQSFCIWWMVDRSGKIIYYLNIDRTTHASCYTIADLFHARSYRFPYFRTVISKRSIEL